MPADPTQHQHIHPLGQARQGFCPGIVEMQADNACAVNIPAKQGVSRCITHGEISIAASQ